MKTKRKIEMAESIRLSSALASVQIQAKEGDESGPRKFSMVAYTGKPMRVGFFSDPVILDLKGFDVSKQKRPALLDHDTGQIVGHTESIKIVNNQVIATGVVSADNEHSENVISASDNGFPWQASVGGNPSQMVFVEAGDEVEVNGGTWPGPLLVARKFDNREISFVPLGADDDTTSMVLAGQTSQSITMEIFNMTFEEWVKAEFGLVLADLTDDTKTLMQAKFDASQTEPETKKTEPVTVQASASAIAKDAVKALRAELGAESERVAAINAMEGDDKIKAEAITGGWDETKAELKLLKASRASAPAIIVKAGAGTSLEHAEVGLAVQAGLRLEDHFKTEQIEKAMEANRIGLSLNQVLLAAARQNGYTGTGNFKDQGEIQPILRAAFATHEISGILSNTANKSSVEGFMNVDQIWREVTRIKSVNDFKLNTSYRLTGDFEYKKIANGGEIDSADAGETPYTNQIDTYARMSSITRTDMINDDLGALSEIPNRLGRGAALKLNSIFWTEFLENALPFYSAARGNLITGAGSALSIASLDLASKAFKEQVDEGDNPLGITASILLTGPTQEAEGDRLMSATHVNNGSTTDKPDINRYTGKYRHLNTAYLDSAKAPGGSSTLWFLLADPRDAAVIETAFLNGQESPTINQADADFQTLGIQLRGFHDFGVNKQEYRGGVKSDGA